MKLFFSESQSTQKFSAEKPIIQGMRISVELILSLLAQGETPDTILADHPDLEPEDLRACLTYAPAVISFKALEHSQD